jgi:glycine/D-amino acid oxidase-like deaminating enzyme
VAENEPVIGISVTAGRAAGVETASRSIAAPVVVDAAPAAGTVPVAEHRGGLFTMSPDGRFVAGPVPDLPGLWVASGCNGSGFSSSLAIGEALAAWITGETPPPGMTDLAPGRFGPLTEDALVSRGLWQYAHYYDPVAGPALSGS